MKKILYVTLALIAGLTTACKNGDNYGDKYKLALEIETGNVNFNYNGGTKSVKPKTNNAIEASVNSSGAGWCDFVYGDNGTILVTVQPYSGLESRSTSIYISDGDRHVTVPVTQTSFSLVVEEKVYVDWNQTGEDNTIKKEVDLTPNDFVGTTATVESSATWLQAEVVSATSGHGGYIVLTPTKNTGAMRTADVTVTTGTQSKVMKVSQRSPIVTSETALTFGPLAESLNVTFEYGGNVTAGTVTASADQTWVTATVNNSSKRVTVTVTPTDKVVDRFATLTLTDGTLNAEIAITQTKRAYNADDIYGTYNVTYTSYIPRMVIYEYMNYYGLPYDDPQLADARAYYEPLTAAHPYVETSNNVIIKSKNGSSTEITIEGFLGGTNNMNTFFGSGPTIPATISFDAVFNAKNRKIVVAAETPVHGITGGDIQDPVIIELGDGEGFEIYLDEQGLLSTSSVNNWYQDYNAGYNGSISLYYYRNADRPKQILEKVLHTTWTRTSTSTNP